MRLRMEFRQHRRYVMKLRMLITPCVVALLSGCVSFGQTGVLVTPIGVAGIHSFAPPQRPDNVDELERAADRITAKATE